MNLPQSTSLTVARAFLSAGRIEDCLAELEGFSAEMQSATEFVKVKGDALIRCARWRDLDSYLSGLSVGSPVPAALIALLRARAEFLQGRRVVALDLLTAAPRSGDLDIDGHVLQFKGTCLARLGHFAEASATLRVAVSHFESIGNEIGIAECMTGLGNAQRALCNFDLAESCFQRAHEAAARVGLTGEMGRAALNLGTLYLAKGMLAASAAAFSKAAALSHEMGASSRATLAMLGSGLAACRTYDLHTSRSLLLQGLRDSVRGRWLRHQIVSFEYLGELRLAQGDFVRARRLFQRAVRIGRTLGDPEAVYEPQYRLAEAELGLGNFVVARRLATEAQEDFAARGDRLEAAFAARVAAQALLGQRMWPKAENELEELRRTLEALGEQFEIHRVERLLQAARRKTPVLDVRAAERSRSAKLVKGDGHPERTAAATPAPDTKLEAESHRAGSSHSSGVPASTSSKAGNPTTPRVIIHPSGHSTGLPDPVLIYGKSKAFLDFLAQIDLHAPGTTPILLEGETGVGKELLARRIHDRGPRTHAAFVPFNCGMSTPAMFDSELFGFVRGAFSGAHTNRRGLSRMADRGTLLLDEIGDLTLDSQARLLRFLDTGEVRPVGADQIERVDVRVVSATHHNLSERVSAGHFRHDLFFRLATVRLRVPSLRERIEDLELLVHHFLELARVQGVGTPLGLSDAALGAMVEYSWPGNIRELRSEVLNLARLFDGRSIDSWRPRVLPAASRDSSSAHRYGSTRQGSSATATSPPGGMELEVPRSDDRSDFGESATVISRRQLEEVLRQTRGSATSAAKLLGVHRTAIYRLSRRFRIDVRAFQQDRSAPDDGAGEGC